MAHSKILRGWKDISAYLGTSVSTAQRWERTLQLPVHRPGTAGSSIFCVPEEVDSWLERTTVRAKTRGRPTVLLIDLVREGISTSRLTFDETKYKVLSASSGLEAIILAERLYVDGFIIAGEVDQVEHLELCKILMRNYPSKPIFLVAARSTNHSSTAVAILDPLRPDEACRIVISGTLF
ncbi:MAG: hypothetical protein WBM04_19515 [Candidatus Korobacteraceae bacterium]